MSTWRFPFVLAACWLCLVASPHDPTTCHAQFPAAGTRGLAAGTRGLATIDATTRWGFRTLSPVTVNSPIIRLNDVVQPLDPNMAGWQRLRRSPIGLVPIDGRPMTIRRARLAEAIRDAEATPLAIDWVGPTAIKVLYKKSDDDDTRRQHSGTGVIVPAAYGEPANDVRAGVPGPSDRRPSLSENDAKRVIHWIELGIQRLLPSVDEAYQIEVDASQSGLVPLRGISAVTAIEPRDQIHQGRCRFHVVGRGIDGPVKTEIQITLSEHPRVVMPRKNLPRGHQIEPHDLQLSPIPEQEMNSSFVLDPSELIGMEIRGVVRARQPIRRDDVGPPILVHRGDLIEVRVVGAGISVTTNAKSLGEGAVSELIEIETLQPRRRLVARVVRPGLVEIVTRAPKVSR